jgi:hypothetical protein
MKHVAVAAILMGLSHAAPGAQVQVDNGASDLSAIAGRMVWDGSVGNWMINSATGSLPNPVLNLSFNVPGTGTGGTFPLLHIVGGGGGGVIAPFGGIPASGGNNNTPFSTTNQLTTQGQLNGPFSGIVGPGSSNNNGGPYQLTQEVIVAYDSAGITTGDAAVVPDGGSSIILFSGGLAMLGLCSRRRRHLG